MQPESDLGDLDQKDNGGNAPIHLAAAAGHVEAVRTLLRLGAAVNQKNTEGASPLHRAAEEGHHDVVKLLLDSGADPTLQDNNGATPSHLAASGGHVEIMELMSKRFGIKKRIKQLLEAAEKGSVKELKTLLDPELPLNEKNDRGQTALYIATSKGHRKFAEVLLEAGADPNIAMDDGSTVLHAAAMSGLATIIEKISSNGNSKNNTSDEDKSGGSDRSSEKVTPKEWQDIYKKCENLVLSDSDSGEEYEKSEYQLPVIEEYLMALFTPEAKGQKMEQMREFLQDLLANLGKRMDVKANLGRGATLLHLAAVCRAEDTVRVLLKRKADVNKTNRDGVTPLMMACSGGCLEVARAIVEAGADPKLVDHRGRTALHYAVRSNSYSMTKYLLSLGLDPNAKDFLSNTPLHLASMFAISHDVIEAVRDAGGDLKSRNIDLLFPCSLATNLGTFKLLEPPEA